MCDAKIRENVKVDLENHVVNVGFKITLCTRYHALQLVMMLLNIVLIPLIMLIT